MSVEEQTKQVYNRYGVLYQLSRAKGIPERAYNEHMEVPSMLRAVGNIRGKKLLDIGCGAGVHLKKYLKKGALAQGIDLSTTMIQLARQHIPGVVIQEGSILDLPYADKSFDIVTASLMMDYVQHITKAFGEVARILKKGGLLYYSTESPFAAARESYEDTTFSCRGIGVVTNKKTKKSVALGTMNPEQLIEWEISGVAGMKTKMYVRSFQLQLKSLVKCGFELVDLVDCKPTKEFKLLLPEKYGWYQHFPLFSIYVARKK